MRLVMIADGSPEIGYGHLMRTNSFAQEALSRGDEVTYLTRTPQGANSVCSSDVSVVGIEDYDEAVEWVHRNNVDVVVTDSYDVDTGLQERLSDVAPTLAVVTDDTRHTLCCDVAINGNVYAPELDYDWIGDEPEWLFGADYLLMREEFRRLADETPPWRDPPERALVTFGGSDMNNATPVAVRAFEGFDLEVDVVIGPGFENEDEIKTAAQELDVDFNLLRNPDGSLRRFTSSVFSPTILRSRFRLSRRRRSSSSVGWRLRRRREPPSMCYTEEMETLTSLLTPSAQLYGLHGRAC